MKKFAWISGLGLLCPILTLIQGCSKDTDLLADAVISEEINAFYAQKLVDDFYVVATPQTLVLDVLSNDSLENNDSADIIKTTEPNHGSVIINEDKTLTYIPNSNQSEEEEQQEDLVESESPSSENLEKDEDNAINEDSFTYTVESSDENGNVVTEDATVQLKFDYGELKAFPGAEGFGKYATGGRGGKIIYVTNLNDSGEGSLRYAIEQSGPRTIIFRVAGYITLESVLELKNGDITIAGQTAPGDGITLKVSGNGDFPCMRLGASNVIIRGIRFRPGPGIKKSILGDGLVLTSGTDIIIDHCSFSWSTDELTDPYGAKNVTYQNCIFSEALMFSSHIYSTDPSNSQYKSPHSMGMLIGDKSSKVTIFNSVFAHNNQRNPLIGGNTSVGGDFELVNNIYYNWGAFGTVILTGSNSRVNLINSLHIPGVNTNKKRIPILIGETAQVYGKNNFSDFRIDGSQAEELAIGHYSSPFSNQLQSGNLNSQPFDFPLATFPTKTKEDIMDDVLNNSGAFIQDEVDKRIIQDVWNTSGNMIDDPSEVGGYPTLKAGTPYTDEDGDGIDDSWEIKNGLDPTNKSDGNLDSNNDGYTNIEDFLHLLTLQN